MYTVPLLKTKRGFLGQVMVINVEDALPSSSVNSAPEEPRNERT